MFVAAKAQNPPLTVIVTVAHSGYWKQNGNAYDVSLMMGFFASSNIDYLSPQLYTQGTEPGNDYTPSNNTWNSAVPWSAWQSKPTTYTDQYQNVYNYPGCKPKIAPSIVNANMYQSAVAAFKVINGSTSVPLTAPPKLTAPITLSGFIQWSQAPNTFFQKH